MGPPRVIADPVTLIAIAWLAFATFSTLVDAFYASKITSKSLCIIREAPRSKMSSKTFTKRLIHFTLFLSTTLLILSTTILALNMSTLGMRRPHQVFVTPVQIRTSGREQVYKDFIQIFLRDLNDRPPAPIVMTPPAPVSGFHEWLTSSNRMATQVYSFMPMVIIYTTLLAVVSDALDTSWIHLLPTLVAVACAAVRYTSRSGLRLVFIFLRAKCTHVIRITPTILWGLLEDLRSLCIYCVELRLTFIQYLVRLGSATLLIHSANSLVRAQALHSIISVLTQLLRRHFLLWYTITIATLLLATLLVDILIKRYFVRLAEALSFLRCAAGAALMMLAIRLDPSLAHDSPARVSSTPQSREATKKVIEVKEGHDATKEIIEAKKDQEDAPAVEGSPVAISQSSENVPVNLSLFPILGTRLTIDKGPKEIYESNHSLRRTMRNDKDSETTSLVSIHPPSATVLAVIEELLKDPASAPQRSPRNIRLTGSEFVYVIMVVIEECHRHHQTVHDNLVEKNERAEMRIRSEARKYRALVLELNDAKSELEHMCESMVKRKDICTNGASLGDSVMHQSEDGKTASASKLELAATPAHVGGAMKAGEEDDITSLQGLLSELRALRNLGRAMLMPDHCSGLEEGGEVGAFRSNSVPHPRVRDLIADCDFARIQILRVISLLAIQRSGDSKYDYAILKKQQAFREELSDRVGELRKEYDAQLADVCTQLQREKASHESTKAFSGLYLRLHSKREHSLQEEVEKRKSEVMELQKDVYCLQRKVKETEALKEAVFGRDDFKEWVLQWFSRKNISKVTGTILETRYRNGMQDLDKVVAQMEVLVTQGDLLNQHAEILQYICTKIFKLDSTGAAAPSSTHSNKNTRQLVTRT